MNKLNLSRIAKSIQTAFSKHSPEILTGIGIAGMLSAAIMAVKITPKALLLIDHETKNRSCEHYDEEKGEWFGDPLTPKDIFCLVWKCYIPATITGGLSIACLICASSVNIRRNTALATAYTISESALKEYQEKVVESVGKKKESDIKDAVAKEQIAKNPINGCEVIMTERGNTLCLDALFKRYFKSDIDKIRKAENELNRRMRNEMFISLNDFYDELGLDHVDIGDQFGWDIDTGYIDLNFSSQLTEDETPCLVIGHNNKPDYRYN